MKSKNIKNIKNIEIVNLNNDNNKKENVNVNTYMKKSKRNSNKENIEITPEIIPEIIIENVNHDNNKKPNVNVNAYMKKSKRNIVNNENIIPHEVTTEITPEIIIEYVNQDIKPNVKALNLVKARLARKNHLVNKNTDREQKILNLVNEFHQDEYIKLQNKTEKLKFKLMKLI